MNFSLSKPKFERMAATWMLTVRLVIISVHFLCGTFYKKDKRITVIIFNFNVHICQKYLKVMLDACLVLLTGLTT